MLEIALASWGIAGLAALIAAAAAWAVVAHVRRGEGLPVTPEEQRHLERVRVREITLTCAGWTYGLVLFFWVFYRPCGPMPGESSCAAGAGQWALGAEFFLLLGLGLLLGNAGLGRILDGAARASLGGRLAKK